MDTWQMIKEELGSLVDALAALPTADWDKPTLCTGWAVRDVVAHLIATANMTQLKVIAELVGSGFDFQKLTRRNIERYGAGKTDTELVDALVRASTRVPRHRVPPRPGWARPSCTARMSSVLGGCREHPIAHVLAVADFYKTSNLLIGTKNRIAGVTLRATDGDWRHGSGPEAAGPAIALVMAMTGRTTALDDLDGDGVEVLRGRT
jgi:Mycothiol maleylpyruvate isomerase N-terminal domain